jgi:hypothetical protein
MTTLHPTIAASLDVSLHAIVDDIKPLVYADGPSREHDLPAYVRAASAIRRLGPHLVIVQDDINALAVRDDEGEVFSMPLPPGPGGRRMFDDTIGNKSQKMDLEACALLPDERLVAFGSGASAARQRLVVVSRETPCRLRDGAELYRRLREQRAFSGAQLNIEGAVVAGDRLLLFQRGNGARGGNSTAAVNAVGALDLEQFMRWLDAAGPAPELVSVAPFDLGDRNGTVFGFTDAALTHDGRIAVLACAEDSSSALTDGPILGCRFGYLEPGVLRMTDVLESGVLSKLKLEGIESRADGDHEFDVVADVDKSSEPSVLARLHVQE